MKIRSVVVICAAVVALTVPTAIYAAPAHVSVPVHAMFGKSRTIHLNLRNDTGAMLEVKVGETVMTLEAGKQVALKLPIGTRITANAATANHQAGSLLAEVTSDLDARTIGVR